MSGDAPIRISAGLSRAHQMSDTSPLLPSRYCWWPSRLPAFPAHGKGFSTAPRDAQTALVTTGHGAQRCARPEVRRVHAGRSRRDRAIAQGVRRSKQPAQVITVPFGHVDAQLLHQSRRNPVTRAATQAPQCRKGRTARAVRATTSKRGATSEATCVTHLATLRFHVEIGVVDTSNR